MNISEEEQKKIEQDYQEIIPKLPKSTKSAKLTFPDGSTYEFPIIDPVKGPSVIDMRSLYTKTGYFTFDPGYFSTGSCASRIAFIDGDKGELLFRGYKIEELAEKSSYIEVCYLLVFGTLPSSEELKKFEGLM